MKIKTPIPEGHQIGPGLDLRLDHPTSETMLTVSKKAFKGYVFVYVAYYNMLKGFATDACKRHWSIIFSFSKIGATFACRQSPGTVP